MCVGTQQNTYVDQLGCHVSIPLRGLRALALILLVLADVWRRMSQSPCGDYVRWHDFWLVSIPGMSYKSQSPCGDYVRWHKQSGFASSNTRTAGLNPLAGIMCVGTVVLYIAASIVGRVSIPLRGLCALARSYAE